MLVKLGKYNNIIKNVFLRFIPVTAGGGQLVPESIINLVVSASELT